MCSENMQQICSRTPMTKYDFNENSFATLLNNLAWVFSRKFLHIFKTHLYKNTFGGLFLDTKPSAPQMRCLSVTYSQ